MGDSTDKKKKETLPKIPRRFMDWMDGAPLAIDICDNDDVCDQIDMIDQACMVLYESPTMQAAFQTYEELYQISIYIGRLKGATGNYCSRKKRIKLNRCHDLFDHVATLAHEYRHAIQDIEGVMDYTKGASRRCTRLLSEADAVAFEITVVYELKDVMPGVWQILSNFGRYKSLCPIYEKVVNECPEAAQNGLASQAVFESYLAIKGIQHADFENYFGTAEGFKCKISPSRAFRAVDQYHQALMGIPYYDPEISPDEPLIERFEYLDPNPDDTSRIVNRLRGLVAF